MATSKAKNGRNRKSKEQQHEENRRFREQFVEEEAMKNTNKTNKRGNGK